ncbi:hypothetical protein AKJ16_DCAP23279 [Drosera capensis]
MAPYIYPFSSLSGLCLEREKHHHNRRQHQSSFCSFSLCRSLHLLQVGFESRSENLVRSRRVDVDLMLDLDSAIVFGSIPCCWSLDCFCGEGERDGMVQCLLVV